MAGLRRHTEDITGLIAVTDSGRSTGKVRIALDVPAPGDIRSALTVLAEGDATLERIFLKDDDVRATDGSVEAIEAADLITLGPGSLFTTVCACLLVPGIARAICNAAGLVVYVANTTRQPGQTDGFGLADHVRAVRDYLGGSGLDAALINDDPPPDHLRAHYGERGLAYLEPTAGELAAIAELRARARPPPGL